jgi:FMN-dependent NADH-azoreductase
MKLLHIDSSVLGDNSVSRQVSAAVVAQFKRGDAALEVVHRDLAAASLPHLALANLPGVHPIIASQGPQDEAAATRQARAESQTALDEFLAADIVVIGAPMYNFGIPSQLKAWIDRVVVPGQTFKYSAEGVAGLASGKRVVVALARGGYYGSDTPAHGFEHAQSYLQAVLGFIGVTDLKFIVAEGVQRGDEARSAAIAHALSEAAQVA